jgi:hypothetical protein
MTFRCSPSSLALLLVLASLATGCGGVITSTAPTLAIQSAMPSADGLSEAELASLIASRPSVREGYGLSWVAISAGHEDVLAQTFAGLPGESESHRISPLVALGRRRFDESSRTEISLAALRLLAARVHTDVLVIVDHGWRSTRSPNGWAAFSVLLLPGLFTPQIDARVELYVETTVLDVRTGAILGETSASDEVHIENMTIWSEEDRSRADAHLDTLLGTTREQLAALLTRNSTES